MFHLVAVVKLGVSHAEAVQKKPVAPRPSAQLVSDAAPIRVAFRKGAPGTVAPGKPLKRKEVPTPAPAPPAKEARVERTSTPTATPVTSVVPIDIVEEVSEGFLNEARVVEVA